MSAAQLAAVAAIVMLGLTSLVSFAMRSVNYHGDAVDTILLVWSAAAGGTALALAVTQF